MTQFYAQPYSIEHTGFYFDSIETFEAGMEALNKKGCEEVEIQFIDGDAHLARLSKSACIGQGEIDFWFEELEVLEAEDATRVCYLLDDVGLSLDQVLTRYSWVCLHHGTAEDYAQELIEETSDIPENLRAYIDYEAIARDMKLNVEIVEIERALIVTNALEF
jgi:antirestriction protein